MDLSICISSLFPGDVDAVDPGNSTLRTTDLGQSEDYTEREHGFSGPQMLGSVGISEPLIRVIIYHMASTLLFLVKTTKPKDKKVHNDKNALKQQ